MGGAVEDDRLLAGRDGVDEELKVRGGMERRAKAPHQFGDYGHGFGGVEVERVAGLLLNLSIGAKRNKKFGGRLSMGV